MQPYLQPIIPKQIHVWLTHANIHRIHASNQPKARQIRDAYPLTIQRLERWVVKLS